MPKFEFFCRGLQQAWPACSVAAQDIPAMDQGRLVLPLRSGSRGEWLAIHKWVVHLLYKKYLLSLFIIYGSKKSQLTPASPGGEMQFCADY